MSKIKLFGGLALGASLLAGAVGSAAGLGVGLGGIQQGTLNSVTCDTDGVRIHYETTFTANTVMVQKIYVDQLSSACAGGELDVIVRDGSGNTIWEGASDVPSGFTGGTLQAGAAWQNFFPASPTLINPAAIESVQVTVYDTYP